MSSNESISCSFCEQRFSSSREMSEHLISCGNKTDQCPNCNKFIRRAIFAYHYENNCASLDDSEDNTRSNNNTEPTSFNQNNHNEYIPCQFCDKPIEFKDYVSHQMDCSSQPRHQVKEQKRSNGQNSIVKFLCEYCKKQCKNQKEVNKHQTKCAQNPEKPSYAAVVAEFRPLPSN